MHKYIVLVLLFTVLLMFWYTKYRDIELELVACQAESDRNRDIAMRVLTRMHPELTPSFTTPCFMPGQIGCGVRHVEGDNQQR